MYTVDNKVVLYYNYTVEPINVDTEIIIRTPLNSKHGHGVHSNLTDV